MTSAARACSPIMKYHPERSRVVSKANRQTQSKDPYPRDANRSSCAPTGLAPVPRSTRGLRRGLHSFAASRLTDSTSAHETPLRHKLRHGTFLASLRQ